MSRWSYAHRQLAAGPGLVWQLAAEEPAGLAAGFGDLAAQLGARDLLGGGDPVAQAHGALAARPGGWLLIFDHAPDVAAVQRMLPPAGSGRVLITSQNPHWPGRQALDVPVLDIEVAAGFLQARTGSADRGAAVELASALGGLPLALEQAAAYILATGRGVAGYLELFRQRSPDLLARAIPLGTASRSPPAGSWPSTSCHRRPPGCCDWWRAAHPSGSRCTCCCVSAPA